MKPRKLLSQLEHAIKTPEKKIVFLWGPRQTGKSTILNHMYKSFGGSYFNFDNLEDQRLFVPELSKLTSSIKFKSNQKTSSFIFIDEVQKYPEATQSMKLLADNTDFVILATGSYEMRAKTNNFDTLAGRYKEFVLFPLTIDEISAFKNESFELTDSPSFAVSQKLVNHLDEMMIFGGYPGVVLADQKSKIEELKNITQNSVIKDIVNIYELKNTDLVYNLLRLLAMQIGNLINITELASSLGSTKTTIDNYLSILAKNRTIQNE
jgi:predicted AAA+ superfamily ATPase